jgi:hypothetical protein
MYGVCRKSPNSCNFSDPIPQRYEVAAGEGSFLCLSYVSACFVQNQGGISTVSDQFHRSYWPTKTKTIFEIYDVQLLRQISLL